MEVLNREPWRAGGLGICCGVPYNPPQCPASHRILHCKQVVSSSGISHQGRLRPREARLLADNTQLVKQRSRHQLEIPTRAPNPMFLSLARVVGVRVRAQTSNRKPKFKSFPLTCQLCDYKLVL